MLRLGWVALLIATMWVGAACQGRPTLGQGCPQALISGTLVNDAGTLSIETAPGHTARVVWPDGVTVAHTDSGFALIGFFGQTIAREGDVIDMGGGNTTGDEVFVGCGEITVVSR
jgi:hypothetical protein